MRSEDMVARVPKVELHVHLEGTLEPEHAFALAQRNSVALPYASAERMRDAYHFSDLRSFLNVYYRACSVLATERDFFDLTWAYLERAASDGVRHVEPFFDPQTHLARGVSMKAVVGGISAALEEGRGSLGISSRLIMCFLRDEGAASAAEVLDVAIEVGRGRIAGVGLDSAEVGFPPGLFAEVFRRARAAGLHRVAHAGEEGPASYITDALDTLGAERIDHGVRCLDDSDLVRRLVRDRVCLTVCPKSNVSLMVVDRMEDHPLRRMLEAGLAVCVNSDDPAYFGGYIADNYRAVCGALDLEPDEVVTLARNAIEGSFADEARKEELRRELAAVAS
jgi:adenosine deaminase